MIAAKKGKDSVNFGIQWLQKLQIVIDSSLKDAINEFTVYKWREDKDGNVLPEPVDKNNHIIDSIRYALEQLISGPNSEETEEFISCVPTETKLLDVRIDGDLIYVDFDETVETGGGIEEIRGRLAQIVFTATQFNPDAGVVLLINGKEIKSFSGEGITEVEKPMHRDEFLDFVKEEKE